MQPLIQLLRTVRAFRAGFIAGAIGLMGVSVLSAQTLYWQNTAGANWDTAGAWYSIPVGGTVNWTNGNQAALYIPGTYTITIPTSETVNGINVTSQGASAINATISGGTLNLGSSNSIVVANNFPTTSLTIASTLTGTGGITLTGGGTLTLSGTSTGTSGPINVNAGTLILAGANASTFANNAAVTVASGATFQLNTVNPMAQGTNAADVTLVGTGKYVISGGTGNTGQWIRNLTLDNGSSVTNSGLIGSYGGINLNIGGNVTMAAASGTASINLQNGVGLANGTGTNTFNIGTGSTLNVSTTTGLANQDGTMGATINGLTKSGGGTLALAGLNTYTGATAITGGTLTLTGLNTSPSYAISSGATLQYDTSGGSLDQPGTASAVTYTGTGTLLKTGANNLQWSTTAATFALGSGALIDVQGGTFTGGSGVNDVWTNNKASLNVASGATFNTNEANVRVPEPSLYGLILMSLCSLAGFWAKRQQARRKNKTGVGALGLENKMAVSSRPLLDLDD